LKNYWQNTKKHHVNRVDSFKDCLEQAKSIRDFLLNNITYVKMRRVRACACKQIAQYGRTVDVCVLYVHNINI